MNFLIKIVVLLTIVMFFLFIVIYIVDLLRVNNNVKERAFKLQQEVYALEKVLKECRQNL